MIYGSLLDLDSIDKNLKSYNNYIVDRFLTFSEVSKNSKVLDFGAGIGTLSDIFYEKTQVKPDCLEICENLTKILISKNYKVFANIASAHENNIKYDIIFSSNVLEHIEDDVGAVRDLSQILSDCGKLLILVPSFQFLYNDADKKYGHYRRYNKKNLIKIAKVNNLNICKIEYFDSCGFFILLSIKLFKIKALGVVGENNLRFYDKFITKLSLLLDKFFKKILGKNIIIVLQKK